MRSSKALLAAGIAYQADGDNKNAATQWQELIEGYPESVEAKAALKNSQKLNKLEKLKVF